MHYPHALNETLLQCKVLAAPFQPVGFAECWLADQFNSLSPLFIGLRDLLCFYTCQINWTDMWSANSPYAGIRHYLIFTLVVFL